MTFVGAIKLARTSQRLRVTFLVDALGPGALTLRAGIAVDATVLFYCARTGNG